MKIDYYCFILLLFVGSIAASADRETTPAYVHAPRTEEEQQGTFWDRIKREVASSNLFGNFIEKTRSAFENLHTNIDAGIDRRMEIEKAHYDQVADPTVRKYLYIPPNVLENLLDATVKDYPELDAVIGKKDPVLIDAGNDLSPEARRARAHQVLFGWVDRTNAFMKQQLELPAAKRVLALPGNVKARQFEFLKLTPHERYKRATEGSMSAVDRTVHQLETGSNNQAEEEEEDDENDEETEDGNPSETSKAIPYQVSPWRLDRSPRELSIWEQIFCFDNGCRVPLESKEEVQETPH